ncbi:phosphocholine cytidylyltransferase family protein [Candidatus Woesearchaeota archaeon]|nr:phosphocholine cytidylyltransferase family protein [Candidatus Woesearchaeota archaeon]
MTKAIIIAAGPGTRLRALTSELPKCMLLIGGKPIIFHTLQAFRRHGIHDISIVRGHKKQAIMVPGATHYDDDNFQSHNILHSFLCAKPKMEEALRQKEEVIVSYSDILYADSIISSLKDAQDPLSIVVDSDWADNYVGRSDHPPSEAEKVIIDEYGFVDKIGKHLTFDGVPPAKQGEFIGLWKFTPGGMAIFLSHIDRVNSTCSKTCPFQQSKEWQKAYITDIMQELVDQKEKVFCKAIRGGWFEIDTLQDYERAKKSFSHPGSWHRS